MINRCRFLTGQKERARSPVSVRNAGIQSCTPTRVFPTGLGSKISFSFQPLEALLREISPTLALIALQGCPNFGLCRRVKRGFILLSVRAWVISLSRVFAFQIISVWSPRKKISLAFSPLRSLQELSLRLATYFVGSQIALVVQQFLLIQRRNRLIKCVPRFRGGSAEPRGHGPYPWPSGPNLCSGQRNPVVLRFFPVLQSGVSWNNIHRCARL